MSKNRILYFWILIAFLPLQSTDIIDELQNLSQKLSTLKNSLDSLKTPEETKQKPPDLTGNYYEILGVSRDATFEQIKTAYKKLALKYHSDKNPPNLREWADEQFKKLSKAYETLSDDTKKFNYDIFLEKDPKEGDHRIFDVIDSKNLEDLKDILTKDPNVIHYKQKLFKVNPLGYAILSYTQQVNETLEKMILLLIEKEKNINRKIPTTLMNKDIQNATPLHYIVSENLIELAKALLKKGAKVNETDLRERTPIFYVNSSKMFDLLTMDPNNSPDFTILDMFVDTPLFYQDTKDLIEKFIDKGIDINHQNQRGWTALLKATQDFKYIEQVNTLDWIEKLLKHHPDPNLASFSSGITPLMSIVSKVKQKDENEESSRKSVNKIIIIVEKMLELGATRDDIQNAIELTDNLRVKKILKGIIF